MNAVRVIKTIDATNLSELDPYIGRQKVVFSFLRTPKPSRFRSSFYRLYFYERGGNACFMLQVVV